MLALATVIILALISIALGAVVYSRPFGAAAWFWDASFVACAGAFLVMFCRLSIRYASRSLRKQYTDDVPTQEPRLPREDPPAKQHSSGADEPHARYLVELNPQGEYGPRRR